MSQYVGCDRAQNLLEGLIDGELSMADQLAVESHLRWCRTCKLRVQDMHLIGMSLRMGAAGGATGSRRDEAAVAAINEGVLMRVRAEREESFAVRLREMLTDMRFLWPALGATAAVAICVSAAVGVLQASTAENPESLSALISSRLEPGTEQNPVRPADNGISIPRLFADDAKRAGGMLDQSPRDDVMYMIRTVVSREGRVTNFEVLLSDGELVDPRSAEHAGVDRAVMDAVMQSRFAPAYTPLGRAVAVDMVWVIAKTTAVVPATAFTASSTAKPRIKDVPKPAVDVDVDPPAAVDPADRRSAADATLTTA
jgi:hypothetical protein